MKFIKENMRLVIAVLIAVILIVSGVIILNINKDNQEKPEDSNVNEQESIEESLNNATGFSKEDAIEIVKDNFESDNYEFIATATNDGLYKVVVKNTVTKSEIIYYVDPTNGNAYIDLGTK